MSVDAVIGLGFGDEGKGKVVSYLSNSCNKNSLVVSESFCATLDSSSFTPQNDKGGAWLRMTGRLGIRLRTGLCGKSL